MTAHDPLALSYVAAQMALEAGRLVRDQRASDLGVETKTSEVDVVTVMDRRSEELLRDRLHALTGLPVLGEEGGADATGGDLTWVVDPIDGTVNYLYGAPEHAVSVACVSGDPARAGAWTPVAGAVYQPVGRRLFRAAAGAGAVVVDGGDLDPAPDAPGRPLRVNVPPDLARTLVATGFAYSSAVRAEQARVLVDLLPAVRDIRRRGSAALDLCAVAEGVVDAYFERTTHVWDVAAGTLVVREAGGVVHGTSPHAPSEEMVLAGAPETVDRLRPLVLGERRHAGPFQS